VHGQKECLGEIVLGQQGIAIGARGVFHRVAAFVFRIRLGYTFGMDSKELANLVREQGFDVFDRMVRAVEFVQERLNRACKALNEAQVPYAVVGRNAVAVWVATIAFNNKRIVELGALVEMKLNSYRDRDRTHLRDKIQLGLITASWLTRFPPVAR